MKEYSAAAEKFFFNGDRCILLDKDFGIVNGRIALGVNHSDVFSLDGIWAPPLASSNFLFRARLCGDIVRTQQYDWTPVEVLRQGSVNGLSVRSSVILPEDACAACMTVEIDNPGEARTIPVQFELSAGIDYVHTWGFSRPSAVKAADTFVTGDCWLKKNNDKCLCVMTDLPGLSWFGAAGLWEGRIGLHPGRSVFHLALAIGRRTEDIQACCAGFLSDPETRLTEAREAFSRRAEALLARFPAFSASDSRLESYYCRSLVHYLLCRWTTPEFLLHPYYSNGAVKGGCVCVYLWDYSGGWEVHNLNDPAANRAHILQFLRNDLTNCYAFEPLRGTGFGPWYPCNQEKIITLAYYYVLMTGDTAFLREEAVQGQTVLDRLLNCALVCDDPSRPAALYDYGVDGEHHLELRRGIPYHGILPDLNARRHRNYLYAYELTRIAGSPQPWLLERAAQLKKTLKDELWNPGTRWFDFITGGRNGQRQTRYTVQLFKLLSSDVLDEEETEGLLSHWNEREFLSEFGLHSMSKLDPAYDQADIDNGGGGVCTLFVPLIAQRLYRIGRADLAADLLNRTLWWAERTPYWGDSFAANQIEYRQDTPYQSAIGAVSGAQAIIFGMAGFQVLPDGCVECSPAPPDWSPELRLEGLRLCGHIFDLSADRDRYTLTVDGAASTHPIGERTVVPGLF